MATRTTTETRREISRKGDVVTVKEVETTTVLAPGKEPVVKEVTRVHEYSANDFEGLPENLRRQLEGLPGEKLSKTAAKGDATKGNFAQEGLIEHNRYRSMHGVEPLSLSLELTQASRKRALELAERDDMTSRTDRSYGENLSCVWSSDPDHVVQAADVVSRWYHEGENYIFDEEPRVLKAGHFTQMIWARTKELGMAAAKSSSNKIYIVASYRPPGNYAGEFKDNVFPSGTPARATANKTPAIESDDSAPKAIISELNREGLSCHNDCRSKHDVPPLKYSPELAQYAQEWANELARLDKMEHRKERKYGENLYCFKSSNPKAVVTAAEACRSWYSEIKHYDFESEPRSLAAGHFTQMVWKGSKEVGMGMAKSPTGLQIIVANYSPPGNYLGTFRANVPKPLH